MSSDLERSRFRILDYEIANLKQYRAEQQPIYEASQALLYPNATRIATLPPEVTAMNFAEDKSLDRISVELYQKLLKFTNNPDSAYFILDRLDDDLIPPFNTTFDSSVKTIRNAAPGDISKAEFLYLLLTKVFDYGLDYNEYYANLADPTKNYYRRPRGQARFEKDSRDSINEQENIKTETRRLRNHMTKLVQDTKTSIINTVGLSNDVKDDMLRWVDNEFIKMTNGNVDPVDFEENLTYLVTQDIPQIIKKQALVRSLQPPIPERAPSNLVAPPLPESPIADSPKPESPGTQYTTATLELLSDIELEILELPSDMHQKLYGMVNKQLTKYKNQPHDEAFLNKELMYISENS